MTYEFEWGMPAPEGTEVKQPTEAYFVQEDGAAWFRKWCEENPMSPEDEKQIMDSMKLLTEKAGEENDT